MRFSEQAEQNLRPNFIERGEFIMRDLTAPARVLHVSLPVIVSILAFFCIMVIGKIAPNLPLALRHGGSGFIGRIDGCAADDQKQSDTADD